MADELSRYIGVKDCTFTPESGPVIAFDDIESVEAETTVETITDRDADSVFDQFHHTTRVQIGWTVTTRDIDNAEAVVLNDAGTLEFTRIGRGDETDRVVSAAVKAVEVPYGVGGTKEDMAEVTVVFQYLSPDGTTPPTVT